MKGICAFHLSSTTSLSILLNSLTEVVSSTNYLCNSSAYLCIRWAYNSCMSRTVACFLSLLVAVHCALSTVLEAFENIAKTMLPFVGPLVGVAGAGLEGYST